MKFHQHDCGIWYPCTDEDWNRYSKSCPKDYKEVTEIEAKRYLTAKTEFSKTLEEVFKCVSTV
jgi:hypothetical protein